MIHFYLVLLSIFYGAVYYLLFKLTKNNILIYFLTTTIHTIIYVIILYFLYNGKITLLLKLSLILRFIRFKYIVKKCKDNKNSIHNLNKKWYNAHDRKGLIMAKRTKKEKRRVLVGLLVITHIWSCLPEDGKVVALIISKPLLDSSPTPIAYQVIPLNVTSNPTLL